MGEHLEIEQKFDVDADFARPDFGGIADGVTAADPVTCHLSATYYDTRDTALAAAKVTLRRRTGGSDEGWHLKLPGVPSGAADSRRELREPLSEELPAALAARVAEITGGAPVTPIATLTTERTIVTLSSSDGSPVAEIADDSVTARRMSPDGTGPAGEPLRWREIEVEVPRECPPVQEAAAALLLGAGARRSGSASKLARLLGS